MHFVDRVEGRKRLTATNEGRQEKQKQFGTNHLLPVSLLVLLVSKAIGHRSPADRNDRHHDTDDSDRVERRMKDELSKAVRRNLEFTSAPYAATSRTWVSSASMGRLALRASQLPLALCILGAVERERLVACEATERAKVREANMVTEYR